MRRIRPHITCYLLAVAAVSSIASWAPRAAHAQFEVPTLTAAELRCQQTINDATLRYVKNLFTARQDCFNAVMAGSVLLDVDCQVDVSDNSSTGDPVTDDALNTATGRLLSDVPAKCTGVDLGVLEFPGFCTNVPTDRAFDLFDLSDCLIATGAEVVDFLIEYEQPVVEEVFVRQERACRNEVSNKASRLFTVELESRQGCLNRQLRRRIPETVDCRLEDDIDAPGTGDNKTDDGIVAAHDSKLRSLSNICQPVFLNAVGFPNMCPAPSGNVYPLSALRDCMFASHHFDMIRFIDVMNPMSSKCGNGALDFTEQCDDGDNVTEPGKLCKLDCSLNVNCGDPLGNGVITTSDVLFILQASIGAASCDLALCDLNGDGFITVLDAQIALLAATGQEVTLSCPDPISLTCGNSTLDRFEQCDDGDVSWTIGEQCNSSCLRVACGDPNDSGDVTVTDAVILLDVVSGERTCDLTVCDVNDDGVINSTDAMIVFQAAGGVNQPLVCPAF